MPADLRRYTPTGGMLRVLQVCAADRREGDARAVDGDDLDRCRRRGLVDFRCVLTEAGKAVLHRQWQRLEDLAHG